ncbi:MAG: methyltransferase domain-containing protein [Parvibaculum sp.]|nr:methyltransferase domain-containing protein [Parvibaculum sp.]MCW5745128.1 methyltransferase domain-containing protein [Alphaproteobacteria bacterium]
MANDIFSNIDGLPTENIQMLADRLDTRSQMPGFAKMRDDYFGLMNLRPNARILELGAGTGVIGRAYAKREGFSGCYVVSDLSRSLIKYAEKKASEEGVADRMEFKVANAMTGQGIGEEQYDAVILHTILSHVPDPDGVLRTAVSATTNGGIIAVFDADYEGLVIASGDEDLDSTVMSAVQQTACAQPRVMRKVPSLAVALDLRREHFVPTLLAEAGESEFFMGLAQAVCNVVIAQGGLHRETGEAWLAALKTAVANRSFFGMCPYFTYVYRKA